jgi:hypothetical protein
MDFFAQPALGADTEAVAHDQHADHQLRIDRWAAREAVERREVGTLSEIEVAIDAASRTPMAHAQSFRRRGPDGDVDATATS